MKKFDFKYKYGFAMPEKAVYKTRPGLTAKIVEEISRIKKEPNWMKNFRLRAYQIFLKKSLPSWNPDLAKINFDQIVYYSKPIEKIASSWQELPKEIFETYQKIGLPQAEQKFLAGVSAQYDSEVIYENIQKKLKKLGVIFCDTDTALKKYPKILKKYFATLVPPQDNKFAALNSAVWSGGSFLYVPKGVKIPLPLQAYFRINTPSFGQFERTLIIAKERSYVQYLEGCTAPIYSQESLHAGVVEIFVEKGARVRYITFQNWSKNVYNLVTKRAKIQEKAVMEWIDCNLGSKFTQKYPSIYLAGPGAKGEVLSIAFAGKNQHQDSGTKMIHLAKNTSSRIISKSIVKDGGRTSYRGLIYVSPQAKNSSIYVSCNALILDKKSRADSYPTMKIFQKDSQVEHEAIVEKIAEDKIFYLTSRGIKKEEAEGILVNGFIEPVAKEIPLEYSIELNRLINLEMTKRI